MAQTSEIPPDISRTCSVGGAFGHFQRESGCGIENCGCFPVLFECNAGLANGLGQCTLTSMGTLLLIMAALINVIVPLYYVVLHIYQDNGMDSHDMGLIRKELSSRRVVLSKQMTKELQELNDETELLTADTESHHDAFYFDMHQFRKVVPSRAIGIDVTPTIKLEVMSKAWISLIFFVLVASTLISLTIFILPAHVDTITTPLTTNDIIKHNATAFTVNATASVAFPLGTRFLSIVSDPCLQMVSMLDGLQLVNISYDMSVTVDNVKFFSSYTGYTIVQCQCSFLSCHLSRAYASTSALPLVYIPWYYDQFKPLTTPPTRSMSYQSTFDYRTIISIKRDQLSMVSSYSSIYSVIDGTKLAFVVLDAALLIMWIYVNRKVSWHRMLPERKMLFAMLLCNVLGASPAMHLLKLFLPNSTSYIFSQSWVVTMNAAWLLCFMITIDQQRRRTFSLPFFVSKAVPFVIAVTCRHLTFFYGPTSITSLVDVILAIIALWVFRAVVMSVRNSLRRRSYAATRPEQLTARVLYMISYCVPYMYFFAALAADPPPVVHGYVATTKTITTLPTQIIVRASTWVLVLIFLPPGRHESRPVTHLYTREVRSKKATVNAFCIESACALYNLSCQAYYAIPGAKDEPTDIDMDLEALALDDFDAERSIYDGQTDTHGFVFLNETQAVVAFRGTSSSTNAYTDLNYSFTTPDEWAKDLPNVRLHLGFWIAYTSIRDQVLAAVRDHDQKQLIFTGHSLGGALATIAAFDIARLYPRKHITMYNYGSPRVGNHAFADAFDRLVVGYRVVNDGDIIVGGPKRAIFCLYCVSSLRYKHVGTPVLLSERAFGTFIVDPNIVEMAFIARLRGNGFAHFLTSYKARLERGLKWTSSTASTPTERTSLIRKEDVAIV